MPGPLISQASATADRSLPVDPVDIAPAPGPLDVLGAQFNLARDRQVDVQQARVEGAYGELAQQLMRQGYRWEDLTHDNLASGDATVATLMGGGGVAGQLATHRVVDPLAVRRAVDELRRTNPTAVAGIPTSWDQFERSALDRAGGRAADRSTVARSSGVTSAIAGFAGGVGGGMTDLVNIATLPIGGGGGTILRAAGREALVNGLTELAQTPLEVAGAARLGETVTPGEIVQNVAFAAAGGAAFEVGGRAALRALRGAVDVGANAREAVLGRIYAALPEATRSRIAGPLAMPDTILADALEHMAGDTLNADQRALIAQVRGEADHAAGSPFAGIPTGDAAHGRMSEAAMQSIMDRFPATPIERLVPDAGATTRRSLEGSTAISTGVTDPVRGSAARQRVKGLIRGAESTGDDAAHNTRSSASGRYQFTQGTWTALYRARYGGTAEAASAAWGARRFDTGLQETLMDDLLARNAAALAHAGIPETAGNLYLAHFAGPGGAIRILHADPRARIEDVLGSDVIRSNPYLRGHDAGYLVAWAARKMNEAVPEGGIAHAPLRDFDPEDAVQQALSERLDAINARLRDLDDEASAPRGGGSDPIADSAASEAVPDAGPRQPASESIDLAPTAHWPDRIDGVEHVPPPPPPSTAIPVTGADKLAAAAAISDPAVIGRLRALIENSSHSLNDMPALVRRLQASEPDITAALRLIASGPLVLARTRVGADGALRTVYSRPPVDGRNWAYALLARHGGIRDEVSARGRPAHDLAQRLRQANNRPIFVPGRGPLVRAIDNRAALTLDQAGELLFESGHLRGADGERPTVAEVLDYLEAGLDDPKSQLPVGDDSHSLARERQSEADWLDSLTDNQRGALAWGSDNGYFYDADALHDIGNILDAAHDRGEAMDFAEAHGHYVNDQLIEGALDLWEELGNDPAIERSLGDIIDETSGGEGGRSPANPGDARAVAADAGADEASQAEHAQWERADDGWASSDPVEADGPWADGADSKAWDESDGAAAATQADSLAHDAKALTDSTDLLGGATAAEARQTLERRGEGRKGNDAPQKPAGSDGGLFDAGTGRQVEFRLDADGADRPIADILADIEGDADALKAIRDCL